MLVIKYIKRKQIETGINSLKLNMEKFLQSYQEGKKRMKDAIRKTLRKSLFSSNKKFAIKGPHILAIPIKFPVSPYISGPLSNPNILLNSGDKIEK